VRIFKRGQRFKIIVGLGNPGSRYSSTRHNVGFLAVERLAEQFGLTFRSSRFLKSRIAEGPIQGEFVCLALPQTFMNLSGDAVRALIRKKNISNKDLLVVCDDIALPLGNLRIRARGGHGGHKGLASIIARLNTKDFARVRIGIGRGDINEDLSDYVLSGFKKSEGPVLSDVLEKTVEALQAWLGEGIQKCMNRFNRKRGVS